MKCEFFSCVTQYSTRLLFAKVTLVQTRARVLPLFSSVCATAPRRARRDSQSHSQRKKGQQTLSLSSLCVKLQAIDQIKMQTTLDTVAGSAAALCTTR